MYDNSRSQSVIPGPRSLLEMQVLRHPDLLNGLGTQLVAFNKLCRWLWARLRLENHCVTRVASQVALVVKNPPANGGDVRDLGSVPGSGRSPGGGHGNPLQYSCLENPMDRGAWWATVHGVKESQTQLKPLGTARCHKKVWSIFTLFPPFLSPLTHVHKHTRSHGRVYGVQRTGKQPLFSLFLESFFLFVCRVLRQGWNLNNP